MFGTKQIGKQAKKATQKAAPVKKAKSAATQVRKAVAAPIKKAVPSAGGAIRSGGAGYRRFEGDALWLPNTTRPEWLDGSLPGDRGFDPLGLGKPAEYLQVDLDELDQNAATNKAGQILGAFTPTASSRVTAENKLSPYDEVFGIERFRECELIHGRWAMLACLGCLIGELTTGVSWAEAGKVQLDGASYLGNSLPFTVSQLVWIEVLLVGGAELYRNGETDTTKRCYPGGVFDPLKLADSKNADRLKEAEIKHARLAMIAFLGYGVQALATGEGVIGSAAKFANSF